MGGVISGLERYLVDQIWKYQLCDLFKADFLENGALYYKFYNGRPAGSFVAYLSHLSDLLYKSEYGWKPRTGSRDFFHDDFTV